MTKNNLIEFLFFGSDEFSVSVLEALKARNLSPALIITTPGKTKRGEILPSPVESWAEKNGIEFDLSIEAKALTAKSWPLFLVASYGKILPAAILNLPTHGTLNIHPSLLPKYRGPTPLQTAILNGDSETGVTIMKLDEKMDHGPVLAARTYRLEPDTSFSKLRDELAKTGANLLADSLPDYLSGKLQPQEQDHAAATYTKKFNKEDAEIKLSDNPKLNYRKILALNPEPGAWLIDDNGTSASRRIKILSAHLESLGHLEPKLIFDRVIPEGKKEMSWESYRRGKS